MYHFEKNSQAFINILTEPFLVQKPMIHQQKAWDISYLKLERQGRGMVRSVPCLLAAKDIEKKKKLTELSQVAMFFKNLDFYTLKFGPQKDFLCPKKTSFAAPSPFSNTGQNRRVGTKSRTHLVFGLVFFSGLNPI